MKHPVSVPKDRIVYSVPSLQICAPTLRSRIWYGVRQKSTRPLHYTAARRNLGQENGENTVHFE
jgi:hypothetical protein